ncbi:MAG: carbon-nitrogen hydrolase family protein [Phycisphaerales bacterium JB039]
MTLPLIIAAAQTVPIRGDVEANLAEHMRLAEAAADGGAQLVVFPELSLTGYELDLARELAFSEGDSRLAPLVDVAAGRRVTLVVGAPVALGGRLHIGAVILGADGATDIYTKRRLGAFGAEVNPGGAVPPAEARVFEPGERDPLLGIGDHRAAIAICADTGDAAHPAAAARRGADLYLASMFIIPGDYEAETGALAGYARGHGMAVVMANYGGPTGGLAAAGGSGIWAPGGERLGRLAAAGAGLAIAGWVDGVWRGRAALLDG